MAAAISILWFGVFEFSSAFTAIAGMIVCFSKFFIEFVAKSTHLYVFRYIPFVWFDWNQFLTGKVLVSNMAPVLCITGSAVIMAALVVTAWRRFCHMDF